MAYPLKGLADVFEKKVKVESSLNDWDLKKAAETAKGTDHDFAFSNANSGE